MDVPLVTSSIWPSMVGAEDFGADVGVRRSTGWRRVAEDVPSPGADEDHGRPQPREPAGALEVRLP